MCDCLRWQTSQTLSREVIFAVFFVYFDFSLSVTWPCYAALRIIVFSRISTRLHVVVRQIWDRHRATTTRASTFPVGPFHIISKTLFGFFYTTFSIRKIKALKFTSCWAVWSSMNVSYIIGHERESSLFCCFFDPYCRNLGFLDRIRYSFFLAAPELYSRGWVDPVPDPLLLRISDSVGNRTRASGSVARNCDHWTREM
jgi:hypothetical protein